MSNTRYSAWGALLVLLASVQLVTAAPAQVQRRAISADVFGKLEFFSQYSAAAYCQGNNNSTGTKITCSEGNCDLVEAADTTTITEFQNSIKTDVTGFVAVDKTNSLIVVSFRGSKSLQNWVTDFSFVTTKSTLCADCDVSSGFWDSWNEAQEGVLAAVATARKENPSFQVIATGHSLGGALATIAAGVLRDQGVGVDLYTYGAPKIGLEGIATHIQNATPGGNFRVTHLNDPIPRLPPTWLGFRHIEPEYYISSDNTAHPTTNDVTVFKDDSGGNEKDPELDQDAHRMYFGRIGACEGDDSIKQGELGDDKSVLDLVGDLFG
ncbi:alpha/beta-hydrolase [Melanomma pulvis-pyrius CBS 109.77]|uniref:Alpha/beta-hydrolase n=1 Tax=Melanomma pulvis-pyrius CBS 109.77 TaxID=1314802 RepID=A0A6A6XWX6_9PLEO|nr:alpha/beta-hydrolase [Melanomma pulvis-pyrius CBS 109.77]